MKFSAILSLSALFVASSAMLPDHPGLFRNQLSEGHVSIAKIPNSNFLPHTSDFVGAKSACEKEDEADCTAYCKGVDATATCSAAGNKVTCFCKGSGGGEGENCEERCLLCMPGKSALEEAKELFKLGGSKMEL